MWRQSGGDQLERAIFKRNLSLLEKVSAYHHKSADQLDRTISGVRVLRLTLGGVRKKFRRSLMPHESSNRFDDMLATLQQTAKMFSGKRGAVKRRREVVMKGIRDGIEYPLIDAS